MNEVSKNNNNNNNNNNSNATPDKPRKSPLVSSSSLIEASNSSGDSQTAHNSTSRITKIALVLLGAAAFGGASYYFAPETVEMGLNFAARSFAVISDHLAFGLTVAVEFAVANPIVVGVAALVATVATVVILRLRNAPPASPKKEDEIPTLENFMSPIPKSKTQHPQHSTVKKAPPTYTFDDWYAENIEKFPELCREAVQQNIANPEDFDQLDTLNYIWENIRNDDIRKADVLGAFDDQLKIDFFHYAVYLYDPTTLYTDLLAQGDHIIPAIAKACPDDLNNFIIAYDTLVQCSKDGITAPRIQKIFSNALYEAVNTKYATAALIVDAYKNLEKQVLESESTLTRLRQEYMHYSEQLRNKLLILKTKLNFKDSNTIIEFMKKSSKFPSDENALGLEFVKDFAKTFYEAKRSGNDLGNLTKSALDRISETDIVLDVFLDAASKNPRVDIKDTEQLCELKNSFYVFDKKNSLEKRIAREENNQKKIAKSLNNIEDLARIAGTDKAIDDTWEFAKGVRFKMQFTLWLEKNVNNLHEIAKTNFFRRTTLQLTHKDLDTLTDEWKK